jgi:hypothetical protein
VEWGVEYLPEDRVVKATTSGAITFAGSIALAADISARLRVEGATRFLVDHRGAEMKLSVAELYCLVIDAEKAGIGRDYVGAIVLPQEVLRDYEFFRTRASNMGFLRGAFTDMDAALEWVASVPD